MAKKVLKPAEVTAHWVIEDILPPLGRLKARLRGLPEAERLLLGSQISAIVKTQEFQELAGEKQPEFLIEELEVTMTERAAAIKAQALPKAEELS